MRSQFGFQLGDSFVSAPDLLLQGVFFGLQVRQLLLHVMDRALRGENLNTRLGVILLRRLVAPASFFDCPDRGFDLLLRPISRVYQCLPFGFE